MVKKPNIIQEKTFDFSVKAIALHKHLIIEQKEFVLSKQFLKSATSIGANVEEAIGAQSKKEFAAKLSIAYKEARETIYWLRLMKKTCYITTEQFEELFNDCDHICRILFKIIHSIKKTNDS